MTKTAATTPARPNRRTGVVLLLAAAGALLGLGALPWVRGMAHVPGADLQTISSTGGQASPIIPALGLVLLAAAVAIALARRVGVFITCLITIVAGTITTVASGVVLNNPAQAMSGQVTETTAILLPADAITDVTITAWPAVSAVVGIVIAGLGVYILRASRNWKSDRRHEKTGAAPTGGAGSDPAEITDSEIWDLLSDGQDPTP